MSKELFQSSLKKLSLRRFLNFLVVLLGFGFYISNKTKACLFTSDVQIKSFFGYKGRRAFLESGLGFCTRPFCARLNAG